MTRYHVIDNRNGAKLGDYGNAIAAQDRVLMLVEAGDSERRYTIHKVEIDARGRIVTREWQSA